MRDEIYINGFKLELTCYACPEQYDVFSPSGKQAAYFRLRHGTFTATCPDVDGEVVYRALPKGDGIFESTERMRFLREAIQAVEDFQAGELFKNESDGFYS